MIDEVIRADTKARHDGETLAWDAAPLNDIHNRLMDAVEAGERSHTPDLARLCATILLADIQDGDGSDTQDGDERVGHEITN